MLQELHYTNVGSLSKTVIMIVPVNETYPSPIRSLILSTSIPFSVVRTLNKKKKEKRKNIFFLLIGTEAGSITIGHKVSYYILTKVRPVGLININTKE